jgi:SAM-dependent methyltransferase
MKDIHDIKPLVLELMGSNPHEGFDASGYKLDASGWQSHHPWFEQIIGQIRPRRILELGTWKGASAIHMAKIARRLDPQAQVLCVDTWLGSHRVLWMRPDYRKELAMKNGFPQQYFQFLANVALSGLQEAIFPLPMTSYCATDILKLSGVVFDLIYIDAHHDEDEVIRDVRRCYDLLRVGGVMLGDDYSAAEPGVIRAVNRFAADQGLYLTTQQEKWAFQKPA